MPQVQSLARSKHVFMGLYGWSGIGKTRLIGSLPPDSRGRDTLIIRPPMEHTDSIRTPQYVREQVVRGWSDMYEVGERLAHEGGKQHQFVWLDGLNAFQDVGMDDVFADTIARKGQERRKFGWDKQEYGINMHRLGEWMRMVISLDQFNFGWTTHPYLGSIMDDNGMEQELLLPWVQGKNMPLKMCGYMNVVAYYQIVKREGKDDTRVLRTNLTSNYFAKDQFDAFANGRLVNPTMPKVMEAIQAARPKPVARKKRGGTGTTKRRRRTTK